MNSSKLIILLLTLIFMISIVPIAKADISNTAVLFLRIAPGARAAGMGEAFVAIADDATTTHWNPAGLANYPLSGSWVETNVPEDLRPLKAVTSIKKGGGSGLQAYEIWALTAKGLARLDSHKWYLHENFQTKTSQTVEQIVSSYFNVTDEEQLKSLVSKVAAANNEESKSDLQVLRDSILAVVTESYDDYQSLNDGLDSLLNAYDGCRIRWQQVREAKKQLEKGLKDGELSSVEIDRVNIAVGNAIARFIPEELKVPYSSYFDGELTSIASADGFLVIGSSGALISYNGKTWRSHTVDDGLPSTNILCLFSTSKSVLIGTDKGMARHSGLEIVKMKSSEPLPQAPVYAIGAAGLSNIWAVIENDLWYFDGKKWSNSKGYQVSLGDTPESIATKFSVYGTDDEKAAYVEKFKAVNAAFLAPPSTPKPAEQPADTSGSEDSDSGAEVDDEATGTAAGDAVAKDEATETTLDPANVDLAEADTTATEPEQEALEPAVFALTPGMFVEAPFLASFDAEVTTIHVDVSGRVWLGTDNGVYSFDGKVWELNGENSKINSIGGQGKQVYLATDKGVVEFDGKNWRRSDVRGMNSANTLAIQSVGDELWFSSEDKTVLAARGRSELAFMHVKWLPELADDLYYEFLSYVNEFDFGTIGINVTFISFGTFIQTSESSPAALGEFDSFDLAVTAAYGTSLTSRLKGGIAAKVIHSRLADLGAGKEVGKGTSTGFAVDLGLLYKASERLTFGMAVTNIGPQMAYIDASQADDLPRNLALGFAYKLLRSDYYQFLVTSEINKILVGLDDGFSTELEQMIINSGVEFTYANTFVLRSGYIYDQEGRIKTVTLGVGLKVMNKLNFDFAYIPDNSNVVLSNMLRVSISFLP